MLKIRLQRKGKRNQPFFRIIVTEKSNPPRGGRALEILGWLNPLTKEKQLKTDRIKHWLSVGAQPSDRVHNLLVTEGIIKEKKKPVHAKPKKKEGEEEKQAPPAPAAAPTGQEGDKPEEKKEAPSQEAKEKPAETPKPEEEQPKAEKPVEEKPVEVKPASPEDKK